VRPSFGARAMKAHRAAIGPPLEITACRRQESK
jgi:hypothetical protein